jgi:hypothetical protein
MSAVKWADSAFPIYRHAAVSKSVWGAVGAGDFLTLALSKALNRKRIARNGRSRQSSFSKVRLCSRGSVESWDASASSGGMLGRVAAARGCGCRCGCVDVSSMPMSKVVVDAIVAKRVEREGVHHITSQGVA